MLVKQEELRRDDRRHDERQRLALAAREQADRLAQPVLKTHVELSEPVAEEVAVSLGDVRKPPAASRGEGEVFFYRHARGSAAHRILKEPAYPLCTLMLRLESDVLPVEDDAAAVCEEAAADGVKERGLACAVCADDRDKVAAFKLERKIGYGGLFIHGAGVKGL